MAIETRGTLRIRGDEGPPLSVEISLEDMRMRLKSKDEVIGDWSLDEIGVSALNDGFRVRAEGEEFVLRTDNDVAIAQEMGLGASSPRLARRLAAARPPQPRTIIDLREKLVPGNRSQIPAIVYSLGGVLVFLGGFVMKMAQGDSRPSINDGSEFWLPFMVAGAVLVAVGVYVASDRPASRVWAAVIEAGMLLLFAIVAQRVGTGSSLAAFGLIAGGIVLGVAALFSGGLDINDT